MTETLALLLAGTPIAVYAMAAVMALLATGLIACAGEIRREAAEARALAARPPSLAGVVAHLRGRAG